MNVDQENYNSIWLGRLGSCDILMYTSVFRYPDTKIRYHCRDTIF